MRCADDLVVFGRDPVGRSRAQAFPGREAEHLLGGGRDVAYAALRIGEHHRQRQGFDQGAVELLRHAQRLFRAAAVGNVHGHAHQAQRHSLGVAKRTTAQQRPVDAAVRPIHGTLNLVLPRFGKGAAKVWSSRGRSSARNRSRTPS